MPSLPEFFVARKYEFKSSLVRPQAPFSLGFTVPDSDEEEVGGTTLRRGSQTNPLTIHESDSESDVSDNEIADLTMMDQTVIVVDDEEERPTVASIHLHQKSSASADEVALVEETYSENESGGGYYSSDGPDDDLNGEESVMGDSVADYSSVLPSGSDFGASDDEMGPTPVPADRQPEAEPKEAEVTLEQSAIAFADRIRPYTSSGAFESHHHYHPALWLRNPPCSTVLSYHQVAGLLGSRTRLLPTRTIWVPTMATALSCSALHLYHHTCHHRRK
jgi:hypothetical protein